VGAGPDLATFHLPACDLKSTSVFFQRALKPEWLDPSSTIHLPKVDAKLFDLYARWLASGTEVMTQESDWKAEYTEYLKWRLALERDAEIYAIDEKKLLCPVTVWDFELNTEAWLLGDFLQSRKFQNHCMGHLYYMHLRFDHFREEADWYTDWQFGTVAYVNLDDVLLTWAMTEHAAGETPLQLEQHSLRKFYVDWLARYWDAYSVSIWDYKTQENILELIAECPDLVCKQLRHGTMTGSKRHKEWFVKDLVLYQVERRDSDQYY